MVLLNYTSTSLTKARAALGGSTTVHVRPTINNLVHKNNQDLAKWDCGVPGQVMMLENTAVKKCKNNRAAPCNDKLPYCLRRMCINNMPYKHRHTANNHGNNRPWKKEIKPLGSLPRSILAFQKLHTTSVVTSRLPKRQGPQVEVTQRG